MRRPGFWRACWLARLLRGLRLDRNPLRRGSDRAETALAAGLVTAFLVLAPVTAVTAGHWFHAAGLREQRAQAAAWHRVPALVLRDAQSDTFADYGPSAVPVPARWAAPDGSQRTGYVGVPAGTRAGISVTAWTDATGRLTGPPLVPAQVADRAALAALAAPLIAAILLLAAGMLARRALDKRRSAAWDAEWKVTGPQWTNSR